MPISDTEMATQAGIDRPRNDQSMVDRLTGSIGVERHTSRALRNEFPRGQTRIAQLRDDIEDELSRGGAHHAYLTALGAKAGGENEQQTEGCRKGAQHSSGSCVRW